MLTQNSEPKGRVAESKIEWTGSRCIIQSFVGQSKGSRFYANSQERTLKHGTTSDTHFKRLLCGNRLRGKKENGKVHWISLGKRLLIIWNRIVIVIVKKERSN